jgi:DNA-binding NarL/FixJ family response regulator
MRLRRSDRSETFSPLRDKTLSNVLRQQFMGEFGYGDKMIFAEAMIERILETIDEFVRPAELVSPGQMVWMAVAADGRKHAREPMKSIPQVPVLLDLVTDAELAALSRGESFPAVRRQRHARLLNQALEQGGVLAQSDLAAISLRHHRTIHDDIHQVQRETGRLLPYRGLIQDIGATLTHKVEVARLLEQGWLEPDIARKLSPTHSLRAVERYAQTYKNVLKLLERGFRRREIASILRIGLRLVDAYIEIVREHHPHVLGGNRSPADERHHQGPNGPK